MMIPEFLKKYESELRKYEREVIRINAMPTKDLILEDSLGIKESKFLGKPFFPKDKEYPKDHNDKPLILIAQINFEEIPHLEHFPKDGILQLFLFSEDWYEDEYKIVYHSKEELIKESIEDFSFLTEKDYDESPIFKIHSLSFKKDIDRGASEDSQFDFSFGGLDYWEFTEALSEEDEEKLADYIDATGHKLGGYAEFTQSDPREYEIGKKEDIQLLQIDVDDEIMFGDSGVGHIFIDKENLIKKDFTKAYFYWDCC
ncbi:YwqG family protein [Tenacibaculum amylolyticum]|uniref:YwqG family protein n=1 Tax=Tenacibaculum amylolyticum TaxID=104269 RepID=UPI0038956F79